MTNLMRTRIEFINHASITVSGDRISILTDPWFSGGAFNNGWSLLYETPDSDVVKILQNVTHIWISHEHPDHFSISFFKKFSKLIIEKNINILFQETKDKRVVNFLRGQKIDVVELKSFEKVKLDEGFFVTCIREGFYDSLLLVENHNERILNLNDCEIRDYNKAYKILRQTGMVDVLLTQFSYAAWKGGKNRKDWRIKAAKNRLDIINLQIDVFKPKTVIPFASFVYFSNEENFYINDSVNKPIDVLNKFKNSTTEIVIMSPGDIFGGDKEKPSNIKSIEFWEERYRSIEPSKALKYESVNEEVLHKSFQSYHRRIKEKNNIRLIKFFRLISPIKIFQPVIVRITDLKITLKINPINDSMIATNENSDLSMPSESLNFLFLNSFGFDTLTVNGCFDEEEKGGFIKATKTLAIENLNNIGIYFNFKILFNIQLIFMFLRRLKEVEINLSKK